MPVHTYSIVAHDPDTGQLGVAVQSHYFCVGGVVPWAEPGIGAVATQSFVEASYGPLGLALMRAGKTAGQALQSLVATDSQADVRQVAMVDARGNAAAHTGRKCVQAAGHRLGKGYSAQANLMLRDTVWSAMAEAFERTPGDLADRLMSALEAAEAEGGDIRGKQSAALLVVSGKAGDPPWSGRLFDLRVDDHSEPLGELRRLLSIARAYKHSDEADRLLVSDSVSDAQLDSAVREYQRAVELFPEAERNPELIFWHAVALVSNGRLEDSLPLFQRVFAVNSAWRELIPRLVEADLMPRDERLIARITALAPASQVD